MERPVAIDPSIAKRASARRLAFAIVGILFACMLVGALMLVGKSVMPEFSAEHKANISKIAQELCAVAGKRECAVSWSGKRKWFGTLTPEARGLGQVGLEHMRVALHAPVWAETSAANGVTFSNGAYEVFYSSTNGAVTITSIK